MRYIIYLPIVHHGLCFYILVTYFFFSMAPLGAKGIEICIEEKEQEGHVAANEFLQQEWEAG